MFTVFKTVLLAPKMSSSHNSEKENSTPGDEALEKVHNYIKEAFEILKHETKRVRLEKEALDEAAKKLEHVHFSKMVKLNVGGHFFSTSLETLTKDAGRYFRFETTVTYIRKTTEYRATFEAIQTKLTRRLVSRF